MGKTATAKVTKKPINVDDITLSHPTITKVYDGDTSVKQSVTAEITNNILSVDESKVSLNVTEKLNVFGRIVIMILTLAGRVGPITLLLAILQRKQTQVHYAKTDVLIG